MALKGKLSDNKDVMTIPKLQRDLLDLQKQITLLQEISIGVPEAPLDGKQYGRQLSIWTKIKEQTIQNPSAVPISPNGVNMIKRGADLLHYIKDAPISTINLYGRVQGGWGRIPKSIGDAPFDSETYGRKNGIWSQVSGLSITNYESDPTSDLQSAVQYAWNDYAGRNAIIRGQNEIILFNWQGTTDDIYQYTGTELGPIWNTTSSQWVAVAGGAVSWGAITGDINAQDDLAKALDAKGSVGLDYNFDANNFDPTTVPILNGVLRLNNVDQKLATEMYASKFSGLGNPLVDFLGGFQEQDYLNFLEKALERDFSTFQIIGTPIDGGDYFTIPITNDDFTGPVANGAPCQLYWTPAPKSTVKRGGLLGEVYAKKSDAPFDGEWVTPQSGLAATVDVGITTTLDAGVPATVDNTGTTNAAIFDFGIPKGIQGVQGVQGGKGNPGKTILSGVSDPINAEGVNGDFYINITTDFIFGPKEGGAWTLPGTSIVGPLGPQGPIGLTGDVGPKGLQGDTGSQGSIGPIGNTGPQGPDGPTGSDGITPTITVGTVTSLPSGTTPTVTDSGIAPDAVFDFGLEAGVQGLQGDTGAKGADSVVPGPIGLTGPEGPVSTTPGPTGPSGIAATVDVSPNVLTVAPGGTPTVTNENNTTNAIFQFGVVTGDAGANGTDGIDGAAGTPGTNGTNGKTILNGIIDPTIEGVDGDFYINIDTDTIFGPRTVGAWGTGTSIVGPQGTKGDTGLTGTAATLNVGLTSTLAPGATATVVSTGTPQAQVFDFGIPEGIQGIIGVTGEAGPQGVQGGVGPEGPTGIDGAQWFILAVDPITQGVDGDLALNTVSSDYFLNIATVWTLQGNLKGATGSQGTQGIQGITGTDGATWYTDVINPVAGTGVDGDLFLNTVTSNYYKKEVGAWNLQGNLKGIQGDIGLTGDTGLQGDQGVQGDTGLQGDTGGQGPIGPTGADSTVPGPQGVQGPKGDAGTGINILGRETVAIIVVKVAAAIGDSWVATDTGIDDFGFPVAIDDVLRAVSADDAGWANIGPIQGPQGIQGTQGIQGEVGPQGIQGIDGPIGPNGIQGIQGPIGVTGDTGAAGTNGIDGATWITGTVNPTTEGVNGDLYLNTSTNEYWLKVTGAWVSQGTIKGDTGTTGGQGIQGIQGETGAAGADGTNGADGANGLDGKTVLNGVIVPTTEGVEGDFYIDTATDTIYGPKTAGDWGVGTPLVGPQGVTGAAGGDGTNGSDGAAATIAVDPIVVPIATGGTPTVTNEGTPSAAIFKFGLVTGLTGDAGTDGNDGAVGTPGNDGAAATIAVGAVTPVASGVTPTVTNVGTSAAAIFDFELEAGTQGIQGIQGIQGDTGLTGAKGDVGTQWLTGVGAPGAIGVDNDMYLDTDTDDYYKKLVGIWAIQGNLKGSQGIQGPIGVTGDTGGQGIQGEDGPIGPDGPIGLTGTTGTAATVDVGTSSSVPTGTPSSVTNSGTTAAAIFDFLIEAGPTGLTGAAGNDGTDGTNGTNGVDGKTVLNGIIAPTTEGVDGDFYIDTVLSDIYGPKGATTPGIWDGPTSLVGATGTQGIQGDPGTNGTDGADGAPGNTGTAATITVDPVATSIPVGGVPTVVNNGTTAAAIFKFGLVVGNTGAQGTTGSQGIQGEIGPIGLDGPQGIQGIQGIEGIDGTNGTAGADGAVWFIGPDDPLVGTGIDGDLFLNSTSSAYFEKVAGVWELVGNLKGNTGAAGSDGATGAQGPQGDIGPDGPTGGTGPQGDQGIQGLTGSQGPQGDTGLTGADSIVPGPQGDTGATGADSTVPGPTGGTGPAGTAATLVAGTTTTLAVGAPATVTDAGTSSAQVFDFGIPIGATGAAGATGGDGPAGAKGDQGDPGLGTSPLGQDTTVNIVAKTALVIGDAYISTDGGVDSEGATVVAGDLLRATDTAVPSNWVTLGPIQGPQGVQGTPGVNGDDGLDGGVGPTGPEGPVSTVPGPTGPAGADGADSIVPGPTGPAGAAGEDGATGPAGPTGSAGTAATITAGVATVVAAGGVPTVQNSGDTTAAVFDFGVVTGNTGATGSDGATGAPGADGVDGAVGGVGPQGDQGVPGADGTDGATGGVGPAGPSAVSTDVGNTSVLGADLLIFTPAPSIADTQIAVGSGVGLQGYPIFTFDGKIAEIVGTDAVTYKYIVSFGDNYVQMTGLGISGSFPGIGGFGLDSINGLNLTNAGGFISTLKATNLTASRVFEYPDNEGTIALTSDVAGFVPYTGATADLDLDTFVLKASRLEVKVPDGNTGDPIIIHKGIFSGDSNIGIGGGDAFALATSQASDNVAIGHGALVDVTDGSDNVAISANALSNITTGRQNIAVGHSTLIQLTGGSDNTAIGDNAGQTCNAAAEFCTYLGGNAKQVDNTIARNNSTAVGARSIITKANQVVLGDASVTEVVTAGDMIANDHVNTSDIRLKENIRDYEVKPIPVKWREYELKKDGSTQIGVIADELLETNPEFVTVPEDEKNMKGVKYTRLLIAKVAQLEQEKEQMEARLDRLESILKDRL